MNKEYLESRYNDNKLNGMMAVQWSHSLNVYSIDPEEVVFIIDADDAYISEESVYLGEGADIIVRISKEYVKEMYSIARDKAKLIPNLKRIESTRVPDFEFVNEPEDIEVDSWNAFTAIYSVTKYNSASFYMTLPYRDASGYIEVELPLHIAERIMELEEERLVDKATDTKSDNN